jgi:hypothetical protein
MVSLTDEGIHRVEVWSMSGKLLAKRNGETIRIYTFNQLETGSIYLVKVKTPKQESTSKIALF